MPRFLPFLFTLSLLLCAGCSTPRRHFSLGIYSAWSVTNLPALRDAGFDLVQGPARKPYLDSAHKLGLKVLAQPGTAAGPSFSATTALRAVQQFDHHPALWAWYLSDEPDLNGIPPEAVRHANRTIHRAGASRPTALVVFNGASLATYHDADILMVDRYPVGWQPLAAFFQHMRHGGTAASVGKKPFYAVIQAFDWTYYGKLLGAPEGTPLRRPTREELRSMTHGALALGASGIFYYCYDDRTWRMPDHPIEWDALKSITSEVRARQPLFDGTILFHDLSIKYLDRKLERNEALEPSVIVSAIQVSNGTVGIPSGRYLLLVNTTGSTQTIGIAWPAWAGRNLPVLGQSLPFTTSKEGWLESLKPYDARVYGPLPLDLPLVEPASKR